MNAFTHPSLRSQRQFVGMVDATRDSARATARTLDQLQGYQRSSTAHIVPMDEPLHPVDVIVITVSAACSAALAVIFLFDWLLT